MGIKDIIEKFKAKFSNDPNVQHQDKYLESLRREKQRIDEREEKKTLKKVIAEDRKEQTSQNLYGIPSRVQKAVDRLDRNQSNIPLEVIKKPKVSEVTRYRIRPTKEAITRYAKLQKAISKQKNRMPTPKIRQYQPPQPQQRTMLSNTDAFYGHQSGFMAQQPQRRVNILENSVNILQTPNLITSRKNKQQVRSKWL